MTNLIDLKKKYLFKKLYYKEGNFLENHGSEIIKNILKLIKVNFKKILIIQHTENFNERSYFESDKSESVNVHNILHKKGSYDLIISNFCLDLEFTIYPNEYISQIYRLLNPNGMVLINFLNDNSFKTLKKTFIEIDENIFGGAYSRFGPFVNSSILIELFQRNKFQEVIGANDSLEVNYSNLKKLRSDFKNLSMNNINTVNSPFNRKLFVKIESIFKNISKKGIFMPVEFEITSISAWK